jgi:hypothetical protein
MSMKLLWDDTDGKTKVIGGGEERKNSYRFYFSILLAHIF